MRIYEAQERIGGRMFSLRDHFADGQVCELGGELIDTGHARIRALADRTRTRARRSLRRSDRSRRRHLVLRADADTAKREILREFAPLAAAIARDAETLPDEQITYATPGGAEALDRESMTAWLDRNGASGWLRKLIEVAYTTEMGLECDEQSALNFLTFIDPGTESSRSSATSDERFHVRGGNDQIPHAPRRIARRVDQTGCVLEALRQKRRRHVHAELQARRRRDRSRARVVSCSRCRSRRCAACTSTSSMPPAKRRAIAELRYGTNAKLMIGFNERVWRTRDRLSGSTYSDLPLQTTWETSRMQPGAAGILTNFVGGRHGIEIGEGTPKMQADAAAAQLDAIIPNVSRARANSREARFHWPSFPWTLGSYACFTPGQWTTIRGAIGERVGDLHFAGEHCAFDNQGFMEGGVETGEWAASAILGTKSAAAA